MSFAVPVAGMTELLILYPYSSVFTLKNYWSHEKHSLHTYISKAFFSYEHFKTENSNFRAAPTVAAYIA